MEQYYYSCDCGSEIVEIIREKEDKEFYFAIYNYGRLSVSFIQRLRYIWRIITKGYPYGDQIIFRDGTAKLLAEDILKVLKEEKCDS